MRIQQFKWTQSGWAPPLPGSRDSKVQLVLVFGSGSALQAPGGLKCLRATWPGAVLFGCSTAGEIVETQVGDETLSVTAIAFDHTRVHAARFQLGEPADSFEAGQKLAAQFPAALPADGAEPDPLCHVLVLSDGLKVNGSDLVRGLAHGLPPTVTLSGGLAGDGRRFQETSVVLDGSPQNGMLAAIGLYSRQLRAGCGSTGGWDPFGPERLITRSSGNVLYELDSQSALGLYKRYLGSHASGLPASGLLFPLSLRSRAAETPVVRTILSISEQDQSLTFAGNVPEGAFARFMKTNFDRLIDGATDAARKCQPAHAPGNPEFALLISCVGRKLVLKQRIEEEVEAVRDVLGAGTALAGFYSYGEISPFGPGGRCELHNQSMTITTLSETTACTTPTAS
ncbi:MAG: FIST N-terminal domain-containing protein [Verrucomicrobiota bacterium]